MKKKQKQTKLVVVWLVVVPVRNPCLAMVVVVVGELMEGLQVKFQYLGRRRGCWLTPPLLWMLEMLEMRGFGCPAPKGPQRRRRKSHAER